MGDEATVRDVSVGDPELLRLSDLEKRWDLPTDAVKRLVRMEEVPFLNLGGKGMRVNWDRVRFNLEEIRKWERSHNQAYKRPVERVAKPVTTRLKGGWGEYASGTASTPPPRGDRSKGARKS